MVHESVAPSVTLFVIGVLLICFPVAATSVAVYGSTSGFLPDLHSDISVVYLIPAHSSGLFDQSVDSFTDASVDVIFIGNDDDFSSATASAIEEAVWDGKVLVVSYPATGKFGDSLPVTSKGTAEGGSTLVVTSLNNGIARSVFSGMNKTFNASEPAAERLAGTLKPGSISLLSFNTGEPALVYRQYGSGYVVEWMVPTPESYLGTVDADIVNYRIIETLVAKIQGSTPTVTTVVTTTVPTTIITPVETTSLTTTGNAKINSDPLDALVYIDGVYQGKTPLELKELKAGYHSVRMTLNGYYTFDGSAYVVAGETITVFGSLQEIPVTTKPTEIPATTTPVPTPIPTTSPSSSDPLSNPTVIAAGIGIITAGIGAYATIYPHKRKDDEKEKKE